MIPIQENIPLAGHTTIRLGGPARYFIHCSTVPEIHEAIAFAREQRLRVQVLGGGSNMVFPDEGFPGVVMRVGLRGIDEQEKDGRMHVRVAAGELWDDVVALFITRGLRGIECLSGIPGYVGATPIQNVGAYGQEVAETIVAVEALERETGESVTFANSECGFAYRQSRFKQDDADRYIITSVTYELDTGGRPEIRYPELQKLIESTVDFNNLPSGAPALGAVRSTVLALRRRKSMVIDPEDPNSVSVGSFFMNPVLSEEEFRRLQARWEERRGAGPIPVFPAPQGNKVPAAWLVEQAGFQKGFRKGGAGISANHALAIINCGGTSTDVLSLARDIRARVREEFGIELVPEPVIVPAWNDR
jgi:UDP-N-acetylmuramate dehydrogenase